MCYVRCALYIAAGEGQELFGKSSSLQGGRMCKCAGWRLREARWQQWKVCDAAPHVHAPGIFGVPLSAGALCK